MISLRHDPGLRSFASDNYAGVHPEVLAAMAVANGGHQVAYGEDVYTERLREVFARHFGGQARVYPVFNGTGANVVGLQAMARRWSAVICAESAHINVDECGAPERVGGLKLLQVPTPDGKLTPELIDRRAHGRRDEHRAQPHIVSLTQSTELGTVYTVEELTALCAHAHDLGMLVHLDGARIANAAASLDVPLRAVTTDAGVDVLSFGGTKNGLMMGEAVVVLNPGAVLGETAAGGTGDPAGGPDSPTYLRKASMQLASKMRFVSAQLLALLEGDLWLRNARHANAMARRLADAVAQLPQVRITRPVQANAVFAVLPPDVADRLRERFRFYTWDEHTGEVRWMTAFDTTEGDVDAFAAALAEALGVPVG